MSDAPAKLPSDDDVVIRVDGVSKCFPIFAAPRDRLKQFVLPRLQRLGGVVPRRYYREFWAVRDISLAIHAGEAWGLIGRNGSGKSTLLQMIAGTLEPTRGGVSVAGRVSALLELGSGFNPEFTGRENVFLNAAILGLERGEIEAKLDDIFAFADIGSFVDQPLKACSSGMIMRLAFAVAVCVEPEILIVDEALAVGDAGFQFKCLARIRRLKENGMTLLFVSHDLAMVKTFCQHAVYLREGRAECIGKPDEVGEAYLCDLRDEQRRVHDGGGTRIHRKPALAGEHGVAFGTDLGDIVDACFADSRTREEVVAHGDAVRIAVEVRYRAAVRNPSVALVILDQRHVVIAGRYAYLTPPSPTTDVLDQAIEAATLVFEFDARLAKGRYFVTVALEDRLSEAQALLVDKQTAVLSFQVLPAADTELIGIFDIGMRFSVSGEERSGHVLA